MSQRHHHHLPMSEPAPGIGEVWVAQKADFGFPKGSDRGPQISKLLRDAIAADDAAADAFQEALETFVLNDGVDAVIARLGSDLVDDQVTAAILSLNLTDVMQILIDAGIENAVWGPHIVSQFPRLRALAVGTLEAAGLEAAASLLDAEGMAITLRLLQEIAEEEFWLEGILAPTASKMLNGLAASLRLDRIEDVAARLRSQGYSWHHANTEARDALAFYGNAVNRELIVQADASGSDMLIAYVGPRDDLTRPFCRRMLDKAYTSQMLDVANNGVPSAPYKHNHGGRRCRHRELGVLNDDAILADLGLDRGTLADVTAANAAAAKGSKKGKKR